MQVKLKDVCTFIGGSQPPKSTFIFEPKEGYIRLIQIRDRLNDNWATYIPKNLAKKKCNANDILIGRYGPPIFQVFRGFTGAYNVALLKAIPKENINNDWLFYFLQQQKIVDFVNTNSKRTAGQWGVDLNMLYDYETDLPPRETQDKIASILSNIDDQIERNNVMCKRLQDLGNTIYCKNAILQKEKINILSLCDPIWGVCPEGQYILEESIENSIKYASGAGDIEDNKLSIYPKAYTNKPSKIVHSKDICISVAGTVGKIGIATEDISIGRAMLGFHNDTLYAYLYFALLTYSDILKRISTGAIQKIINNTHLEVINIPKYTTETVNALTQLLDEILSIEKNTVELNNLKQNLLPLLINGQLVVD